jgi:hypothetical protein
MPRQSSVQPGNRRPVPTSNPKGRVPAQMDQLGVRRVRRLPCGRYQPSIRKAGTPHRGTFSLSSPFFRDLRNRKRQPQIGPRSCAGFRQFRSARGVRRIEDGGHAVLQVGDPIRKAGASFGATENANRRLGLVRVRGSASSDPRGAYAASKTADAPYSKLEAVLQVGGRTPSWRPYSKLATVLQVGGGAPVGWRAFGLIAPRGLVVELRR